MGFQIGRSSPFSVWAWDIYPGFPDLAGLQVALEALLVTCAVALAFRPRKLDLVQFAALSGALMLGFELVLTHWSYLYLPWAFPFALLPARAAVARDVGRTAGPDPDSASRRSLHTLGG